MSDIENNGQENNAQILEISPVEATTRAELDVAIVTANRFPRNIAKAKAAMLATATLDEDTAAACFYRLPRGGKAIEGPSVRLAEIVATNYKNIRVVSRTIHVQAKGDHPHVIAQAVAHDLENNVQFAAESRRRIVGKKAKGYVPDDDDIQLAASNAQSLAYRNAVFKVVPLALVKPVLDAAMKVARGEAKPMADRVAAALKAYAAMGVTKEQVLVKFGYTSEAQITPDDLDTLSGLRTALREGDAELHNEFPPIAGASTAAKPAADGKKPTPRNREASPLDLGGKPTDSAPADTPPPFGDDRKEDK